MIIFLACAFIVFLAAGTVQYLASLPIGQPADRRRLWASFAFVQLGFGALAAWTRRPLLAFTAAYFVSLFVGLALCWRAGRRNPAPLPPPVPLAVPVEVRRLRDFTSAPLELLVLLLDGTAFLVASPFLPVLLYGQALLLLTKHALVRGSLVLPAAAATEHEQKRTEILRVWSGLLDRLRLVCAVMVPAVVLREQGSLLAFILAALFLYDMNRRAARVERLERELKERTGYAYVLAYGAHEHFRGGGLVYWNREHPAPLVQGPLGYTLNMANPWAGLYLASLVGLLAVLAVNVSLL